MSTKKQTEAIVRFIPDDAISEEKWIHSLARHARSRKAKPSGSSGKTGEEKKNLHVIEEDGNKTEPAFVDDETEEEEHLKESTLMEDGDVIGNEVYGFKTPKRKNQMALKAASAQKNESTPTKRCNGFSTPQKGRTSTPQRNCGTPQTEITPSKSGSGRTPRRSTQTMKHGTPKRDTPVMRLSRAPSTPHRTPQKIREEEEELPKTPYSLRKRLKTRIQKEKDITEEFTSDQESLYSSEESDDGDSDFSNEGKEFGSPAGKTVTKTPVKHSGKTRGSQSHTPVNSSDDYFLSVGTTVTSDHTLSRLDTPRLDHAALQTLLSGVDHGHVTERAELVADHRSDFHKWMSLMKEGFNLLLFGVGSKRNLLESFQKQCLRELSHVVINGFFPSITMKQVLSTISEDLLECESKFASLSDHVEFICSRLLHPASEDIFVLVHNLDGPLLRNDKAQSVFCQLTRSPRIHLVATIDHINATLIWDQSKFSMFRFVWFDVTTFDPYLEETSYENSLMVQQSGSLALSSLTHVFQSLTPNAKKIFLLIAEHQLGNKDATSYPGMSFQECYQKCREGFVVNSDLTLRAHLTEFHDHKLIRSRRMADGAEYIVIQLSGETLQEFVTQQQEEEV